MPITLDTIRMLDADKSYYIANSTGTIKEATGWQKIKCFLGVGDGRAKAARLAEAIKTALLDSAGQTQNAELAASLD